jgi:hypothetical protein
MHVRPQRWVVFGVLFLALLGVLLAPRRALALPPPTRVSVLTMGPGDHPFTRFGHNALLLEWPGADEERSLVYNFGTFEFDGWRGARDFMQGRFRYWLSVSSLKATLHAYGAASRSLTAQELELTGSERAELFQALAVNALPEHRYYDYDYYRDNCSTRVRDAVDRVLRGQLRRGVRGAGRLTFREHTLRLTGQSFWLYLGLDLALGRATDRPTTRWEELFLPQELHDELGSATRELDGKRVPLVRREQAWLRAEREPAAALPPARVAAFGALGLSCGALLALLGVAASRAALGRVMFGIITALLGAGLGALGAALTLFSASRHWAAHDNPSLLACPPWALALSVLGVLLSLGRVGGTRLLRGVLGASAVTSGFLLSVGLAGAYPESLRSATLFFPLWAGWLYGAFRATAQRRADLGGGGLLDAASTLPDAGGSTDSRSASPSGR